VKLSETVRTEEESDEAAACEAGVYDVGLGPVNESAEEVCWIGDTTGPLPVFGVVAPESAVDTGGSKGLGV
jgi:hypothetical protein